MITDIFPKSVKVLTIPGYGSADTFERVAFECENGGHVSMLLTSNNEALVEQFAAAFKEAAARIRARKASQQAAE